MPGALCRSHLFSDGIISQAPFAAHLRPGIASSDFDCGILKNMLINKENGEAPKGLSIVWNDRIANLKYQILRRLLLRLYFVDWLLRMKDIVDFLDDFLLSDLDGGCLAWVAR